MEKTVPVFKKYVFVCENEKPDVACCGAAGTRIREILKDAVKKQGASKTVRVSRAGCLDVCAEGPNVLVMPDNIWFKRVSENDIPEILETILGGQ